MSASDKRNSLPSILRKSESFLTKEKDKRRVSFGDATESSVKTQYGKKVGRKLESDPNYFETKMEQHKKKLKLKRSKENERYSLIEDMHNERKDKLSEFPDFHHLLTEDENVSHNDLYTTLKMYDDDTSITQQLVPLKSENKFVGIERVQKPLKNSEKSSEKSGFLDRFKTRQKVYTEEYESVEPDSSKFIGYFDDKLSKSGMGYLSAKGGQEEWIGYLEPRGQKKSMSTFLSKDGTYSSILKNKGSSSNYEERGGVFGSITKNDTFYPVKLNVDEPTHATSSVANLKPSDFDNEDVEQTIFENAKKNINPDFSFLGFSNYITKPNYFSIPNTSDNPMSMDETLPVQSSNISSITQDTETALQNDYSAETFKIPDEYTDPFGKVLSLDKLYPPEL